MNKTKRGLQLAAGIVGIVGAAILLISSIYTMIFFGALFEGVSADEAGVALLMVSLVTMNL